MLRIPLRIETRKLPGADEEADYSAVTCHVTRLRYCEQDSSRVESLEFTFNTM